MTMILFAFASLLLTANPLLAMVEDPCKIPGEKAVPGQLSSQLREMETAFGEAFKVVEATLTEDMKSAIITSCQSFEQLKSQKAKDKLKAKGRELYDLLTKEIGLFSGAFPKLKTAYSKMKEKKLDYSMKSISPIVVFSKDVNGDGTAVLIQRFDFCPRLQGKGSGMISETLIEQAPHTASGAVVDTLVKTMTCTH